MGCLLSKGQLITSCLQESVTSEWFYAYLTGVAERIKHTYGIPLVLDLLRKYKIVYTILYEI